MAGAGCCALSLGPYNSAAPVLARRGVVGCLEPLAAPIGGSKHRPAGFCSKALLLQVTTLFLRNSFWLSTEPQ